MDQEKISKFIKEIRKSNNLTQNEFASILGVTYQAVSKWETGKNIPDIAILKSISDNFNVNIDDILEGKTKNKKISKKYYIFGIIAVIILFIILLVSFFIHMFESNDFEFKTLSTGCSNFIISGSIAYNESKSSIYISDVKYCGGDDTLEYENIECALYEEIDNTKIKITTCEKAKNTTLEEFLSNVKLNIDNYSQNCKNYVNNNLYLEINATDNNNKSTVYKVPLTLDDNCKF